MEAAPGDEEQINEHPGDGSSRLPSRITLGWPFFTYQLSLKALLVVTGAAAAVVIIAAVFVVFTTPGSGESGVVDIRPFRLAATMVEVQQGAELRTEIIEEWQDSRRYRFSLTRDTNAREPGSTTELLADGKYLRFSNSLDPVVTRTDIPVSKPAKAASVLFYMQYGPVAGVRTIPDLIDKLTAENANFDPDNPRSAKVVGEDTWLGIPVEIIEYCPLWSAGTAELRASGQAIESGGLGRAWVDPATAFILRNESTVQEGWTTVVQVTSLEYDAEFAQSTFTFDLPPGKTEVIATPGSEPAQGGP